MELAIIESRNRLNDDEEVGKPASLFFNVGLPSAVLAFLCQPSVGNAKT
jgi:hypothetical protein